MIEMLLWSDGHKFIKKIIKIKNLNLSPLLSYSSSSVQLLIREYFSVIITW
jgi:hypothetical protein